MALWKTQICSSLRRLIPLQPKEKRVVGSLSKCEVRDAFVLVEEVMLINRQPENNRDNFLPSVSLPSLGLAVSLGLQAVH